MKHALLALALIASPAIAGLQVQHSTGPHDPGLLYAGVTCQTIGSYTYCNDTQTQQRITCQVIGSYTYCN